MRRGDYSFLTRSWIRERFIVRDDGVLVWRSGQLRGEEAGTNDRGYVRITFSNVEGKRRAIYAHLIVWVWHMGKLPVHDLDHISRIKHENWIENLRDISRSHNQANVGKHKRKRTCSSQYKGVTCSKQAARRNRRWRAQIRKDGKLIDLGWHHTEQQAALAYDKAARGIWGECAGINFPHVAIVNDEAV